MAKRASAGKPPREKRGRGRPNGTGRYGVMLRAMVEPTTADAVSAWQKREGVPSLSEAARDLLKLALKAEGLL